MNFCFILQDARSAIFSFSLLCLAMMPNRIMAEPAKIPVRIGDFILNIPENFRPSLGSKYSPKRFEYEPIADVPPVGAQSVESIFIQIDKFWPTPEERRAGVLSINAQKDAPKLDLYCIHKASAKTEESDMQWLENKPFYTTPQAEAVASAGSRFVFSADDVTAFGSSIVGSRTRNQLLEMMHHVDAFDYLFVIAIGKNTILKVKVSDWQVKAFDIPALLTSIEREIGHWRVGQSEDAGWFHKPGASGC